MTYWLKRWGTSGRKYEDGRLPSDHLSWGKGGKPSVTLGDRIVILGVGTGNKLVATMTALASVVLRGTHADWPWEGDTRIDLEVGASGAPTIDVMPDALLLRRWMNWRKGYRKITKEQFEAAEAAIREAGGQPRTA